MKKIFFILPLVLFLAAGCKSSPQVESQTPSNSNSNPPVAQVPVSASSTPSVTGQVYETNFLKVTVPNGWVAKEAVQITYVSGAPVRSPNPAAVNITKGNYILYINSRASQASGVDGGRFVEFAGGAPSVDATIISEPGGPCGTGYRSSIVANGQSTERIDYYISSHDDASNCNLPTNGKNLWYFSVVGNGINYFNIPEFAGANGWVVTMAYNSKTINSFPEKSTAELKDALNQMTIMARSLVINPPVVFSEPVSQTLKAMANTYWTSEFSEGANYPVVSCNDTAYTHNISLDKVQSSQHMETLGSDSKTNFTSHTDVASRSAEVSTILTNDGWTHCNSIAVPQYNSTTEVFKKGNEIVNVETSSSGGKYFDIFVTFFKLF